MAGPLAPSSWPHAPLRPDSLASPSHLGPFSHGPHSPPAAGRKSTAITCAKRLAQFLGDERIREKGLVCNYVIARRWGSAGALE